MDQEPKQPVTPVIVPSEIAAGAEVAHALPDHLVGGVAAGAAVERPVDTAGALPIGDLAPAAKPSEPYSDAATGLGRLGGDARVGGPISAEPKPYEGLTLGRTTAAPGASAPRATKPSTQVPGLLGPGIGNTNVTPWSEKGAAEPAQPADSPDQE